MPTHSYIDSETIEVTVDGIAESFDYNEFTHSIHIGNPGRALSKIEVKYCQSPVQPVLLTQK